MSKENKEYLVHVQFDAIEIRVTAKNRTEAKKKARARVAKRNPVKMIDRHNFFCDEFYT